MAYHKTCKICGKEFDSESRNTVYCSDKCSKSGAKKAARKRKIKHANAVKNGDSKEIDSIISQARKLSRDIAELCLHKKCGCKNPEHICDGDLVVHHIDHNPLNCHPSNLMWLCEKAHNEIHTEEFDCSNVDELKAYITIRQQVEIRQRNAEKRKLHKEAE